MVRVLAAAAVLMLATGCTPAREPMPISRQLVFLTRGDCANTVTMRANLDDALKGMGAAPDYAFVALESLPPNDPRTGYPTPTILLTDRDLFGMAVPTPPFPQPT